MDGAITFLGHRIDLAHMHPSHFAAVRSIKNLRLTIGEEVVADHFRICNIQDALFILLARLRKANALETLFHWQNPGSISRRHVVAFLADALCVINNANLVQRKNFTLQFDGRTMRPWKEIEKRVRHIVGTQSVLPDYTMFFKYFSALRRLIQLALGIPEFWYHENNFAELGSARIRGDILKFHRDHGVLMNHAVGVYHKTMATPWVVPAWAQEHQERAARMLRLYRELQGALPPIDANTSCFGYSIVDEALREWNDHGWHEARAERIRRKAARKAAAELDRQMAEEEE